MKKILIVDSNFHRLYTDDNFLFGGKDIQLKAWSDHFLEKGYCVHAIARNSNSSLDSVELLYDGHVSLMLKMIMNGYDIVIFREFNSKLIFLPLLNILKSHTVFMVSSDAFFLKNRLDFLARSSLSKWKEYLYNASLGLFKLYTLQTDQQVYLFNNSKYSKKESILLPNLLPRINKSISDYRFDFVWVGNIREVKQPLLFAEMAASMPQFSFGMFGRVIDERLLSQLREYEMCLENFEIILDVSRGQILDTLSRSVALVNTSKLEGFPNTFLEAWSLQIPVLSFVNPDRVVTTNFLGEVAVDVCDLVIAANKLVSDPNRIDFFKKNIASYIHMRKELEEGNITKFIHKCT